jgi:hypothetical protein
MNFIDLIKLISPPATLYHIASFAFQLIREAGLDIQPVTYPIANGIRSKHIHRIGQGFLIQHHENLYLDGKTQRFHHPGTLAIHAKYNLHPLLIRISFLI